MSPSTHNPDAPSSAGTITVLVVEDEDRIRRNQVKLLREHSAVQVVGTAADGPTAVERAVELKPDVVLLDLGLPGMDGIAVTRELKKRMDHVEVLIFTIFDEEAKVLAAIQAGASGYLLKGASVQKIVEAIGEVQKGGSVIQATLARRLLRHFQTTEVQEPAIRLTPREKEILQLIAKGMSNREVARILELSRSTVRTHLEHIYQKLEVSNRTEAVTEGLKHGLIDL
jgi:DNA-binding NarL/FixJ family response regulator